MKMISINNRRYIGSKFRMINFIKETMKKEKIEYSSFLDLFGGTGIVGDFFNDQKTKVYVNDLLKSNYISYLAWFGNEKIDKNKIREEFNIPDNLEIVCLMPLGYRREDYKGSPWHNMRKELEEVVTYM